MKAQKNHHLPLRLFFLLAVIFICSTSLYPDFILDLDTGKKKTERRQTGRIIPDTVAYNIRAETIPGIKGSVKVSFEVNQGHFGAYYLFRSTNVINTSERVFNAHRVKQINAGPKNVIIDSDLKENIYFYAAISKRDFDSKKILLFRDVNYTSIPVSLKKDEGAYLVSGIQAKEIPKSRIQVTWNRVTSGGVFYSIYRGNEIISSIDRLRKAVRVALITDADEYIDREIPKSGLYFYAVTARKINQPENTMLIANQNYTVVGVQLTIKDPLRPTRIVAKSSNGGVTVEWDYTGKDGSGINRIFRSAKKLTHSGAVTDEDILKAINLRDKQYIDTSPPAGNFYYGLVPEATSEMKDEPLVTGVTITKFPLKVIKKNGKTVIEKPHKKISGVDLILKRTFFKNRFPEAIKELQELIENTDNKQEAAKANLFIGRSNIELKRYRTGLDYLILSDVQKFYPKEAEFWEEFALSRMR